MKAPGLFTLGLFLAASGIAETRHAASSAALLHPVLLSQEPAYDKAQGQKLREAAYSLGTAVFDYRFGKVRVGAEREDAIIPSYYDLAEKTDGHVFIVNREIASATWQGIDSVLNYAAGVSATPPPLDVVFLIDHSGSMNDAIRSVESNVTALAAKAAAIKKLGGSSRVRLAVIGFGTQASVLQAFTEDPEKIRAVIKGIHAGDGKEVGFDALDLATNRLEWSGRDTNKMILVFTDDTAKSNKILHPNSTQLAQLVDEAAAGLKNHPNGPITVFPILTLRRSDSVEVNYRP